MPDRSTPESGSQGSDRNTNNPNPFTSYFKFPNWTRQEFTKVTLTVRIENLIESFSKQQHKERKFIAKICDILDKIEKSSLTEEEKKEVINTRATKANRTLGHHMAQYNLKPSTWQRIDALGFDFNSKDAQGRTAPMISVMQEHQGFREIFRYGGHSRYDFYALDHNQKNIFDLAFKKGNLGMANYLVDTFPDIKKILKNQKIHVYYDDDTQLTMNGFEAFKSIYNSAWENVDLVYKALLNIVREHGNLEDTLGYINSYNSVVDFKGQFNHFAFAKFFPVFYCLYPFYYLDQMLVDLEELMDNAPDLQSLRHHPNTAEFLAMLSHPGNKQEDHNTLTSSFTSPYALIDEHIDDMSGTAVQTLKVIGILGLSFRQFKFESIHTESYDEETGIIKNKSILEQYGFTAVTRGEESSDFGSAFYLKGSDRDVLNDIDYYGRVALSEETMVVFMRGGFLICHDLGSVFIRNSSLKFGRDLLKEPAYYLETPLLTPDMTHNQISEIINMLEPATIENQWTHILHTDLYLNDEECIGYAGEIVKEAYLIFNDVRKWQCDMDYETAWVSDEEGQDFVIGAYKSPGFKATVDLLYDIYTTIENEKLLYGESDKVMPVLGFVPRGLIPFEAYVKLEIGADQITVLKSLAYGADYDEDLLYSSGVYDFFQTGFKHSCALMIMDKDKFTED